MGFPKVTEFTLPNLFSHCNLELSLNPHFDSVRPESSAWITSYKFFAGKKQEHFINTNTELLVAYTYPDAGREDYRTICDIMSITWVCDMLIDEQDADDAQRTGDIILRAYASQSCTESSSPLYRCISEVVANLNMKNLVGFKQRFLSHYRAHIDAMVREAHLRSQIETLSLKEYTVFRREVTGVRLFLDLIEFALGVAFPNELFEDKAFQCACDVANDMVGWANDLYSYNMEQSIGLNANILTVFMAEYNMSLQEAANHLGVVFQDLMKEFLENKNAIRSYGPEIDEHVHAYMQHLGYWVAGNLEWSFASQRYFGKTSDEVRKSGVVKLTMKSVWSED